MFVISDKWRLSLAVSEAMLSLIGLAFIIWQAIFKLNHSFGAFLHMWTKLTYLSGLAVVIILATSSFAVLNRKRWIWLDSWRGFGAFVMVIVGVVSATLLSGLENPSLISIVMHIIVPLSMVLVWLVHKPYREYNYSIIMWPVILLFYLVFAMWHGHRNGDFLYPFLDVNSRGLASFAVSVGWIMLGSLGILACMWRWTCWRTRKQIK